jgi:hypothetical protein
MTVIWSPTSDAEDDADADDDPEDSAAPNDPPAGGCAASAAAGGEGSTAGRSEDRGEPAPPPPPLLAARGAAAERWIARVAAAAARSAAAGPRSPARTPRPVRTNCSGEAARTRIQETAAAGAPVEAREGGSQAAEEARFRRETRELAVKSPAEQEEGAGRESSRIGRGSPGRGSVFSPRHRSRDAARGGRSSRPEEKAEEENWRRHGRV